MKKELFNGKRLKTARAYRGKTVDQVATESKINKKDILAFEDNKYVPTPENTLKLANVLQFPREYFFQKDDIKLTVENTHIRPESKIPRVEDISFKEKMIMTHRIYSFIEQYIKFPQSNLPQNIGKFRDMEELATKVREYWELGDGPVQNTMNVLENNGVLISSININKKGAVSFSQKQNINKNSRYIVCLGNDKKSATIRNYDLAYELGYIISSELGIPAKRFSKEEFAATFLLPREAFLNDLTNPDDLESYIELKAKWIAPISVMIMRAYELGAINYKKCNYLLNEMHKLGWTKQEPLDDNIKATSPQYLKASVDLLLENKIMSADGFINNLGKVGINIYSQDVEELLGLKEGTLASRFKDTNNVKVVNFKKK